MSTLTELGTLDVLEAEAVHIIRECAAECERPVLLFSGGIFVYVGAGFDKPLPIIPMGGMSLMGGWLVAALAVCRQSVRDAGFHTARLTEKEED